MQNVSNFTHCSQIGKLYHSEVYLPESILVKVYEEQNRNHNYNISYHFLNDHKVQDFKHRIDTNKLLKLANSIKNVKPFEVEITDNKVTKYCVRLSYDNDRDIAIVIRNNKIVTAWLNYKMILILI